MTGTRQDPDVALQRKIDARRCAARAMTFDAFPARD
jgi:hypothetical protein